MRVFDNWGNAIVKQQNMQALNTVSKLDKIT